MKTLVVGTGAGGATAARELQSNGFEVHILEAGPPFKPFTRHLSWTEPIRRLGLLGDEQNFKYLFPAMKMHRSSPELVLIRGIATGGSTVLSCGNMVRSDTGLKEIGLDLNPEFQELEDVLNPKPIPLERWRPLTHKMFQSAKEMGLNPSSTPKVVNTGLCSGCGLCELGCKSGARWDFRRFLNEAIRQGATLYTNSPVKKIIFEKEKTKGVLVKFKRKNMIFKGDLVVLAAGGIGTAQILKNSGLPVEDNLWADIVLTLGGVSRGSQQLNEPPMVWYTQHKDYILSPYLDILSHFFHKPWRNISIQDRVGLMIKLADVEKGTVYANGKVEKSLSSNDKIRLRGAVYEAAQVMDGAGVSRPFIEGMYNGGHLGGTVPLKKDYIKDMKPSWLPEGLWVADLSLSPRSQGMPTMLLTAALALRVARKIVESFQK